MKPPFDMVVLRQRLATQHDIHPARDPGDFQHAAEIVGLTPGGVGYDRCAVILNKLRREAKAVAGDDFALSVTRDPRTGQRRGYAIHTNDQMTANQIADAVQRFVP